MSTKQTSRAARVRRHARVRRTVRGTALTPRLAVFRSNQHIYAQVIDDEAGRTIAAASDVEAALRADTSSKSDLARQVGALVAQRGRQAGVTAVVFDRGGFRYAGRVQALADAAREEGLVF
ncbi:MAG: 50S ribosomal protein L18 [Dehalococcoidia bacterium]|nr:50S ribosomal protein L18 [Dehalococcoidia bacterium]